MKKTLLITLLGLSISSTSPAVAQSQRQIDFAIEFFNKIQPRSIAENREYCGYFGLNDDNQLVATAPTKGDSESCYADEPPYSLDIVASYHTHAGHSYEYDSEVPSSNDLEADIAEEVDGFISTPGGRIWFNSASREIAILICGRNCTVSDSDYDPDDTKSIRNRYTVDQLVRREQEY